MIGRPPKYKNKEQLIESIEKYFTICKEEKHNPSITGLALHLGFESRQSFYDYEKNEDYSYTIKKARLRVENMYEEKLLSNTVTGAIFALKNLGWSDKQEIDHTVTIPTLPDIIIK